MMNLQKKKILKKLFKNILMMKYLIMICKNN